jgi:UDP-hydrolysing UDP-N-acetyl-D-glucosamine 2-epimerase
MARCLDGIARALERLKPDLIVVTGDRYELLPICSAALVLKIPIAHISGGDVTLGALDNQVRHAVTKMAHLHFPGTPASARRIVRMGENPRTVFMVGEPGLESFRRTPRVGRRALARRLDLDPTARWILFTYHPETLVSLEVNLRRVRESLRLLRGGSGLQVILLDPNADFASRQITAELRRAVGVEPSRFRFLHNLQPADYINVMRHCYAMVGNSSAGILEAPSAQLAVIDIGERQKGRLRAANVVHADGSRESLRAAWHRIGRPAFRRRLTKLVNPFGDGHTGARIARVLARVDPARMPLKGFYPGD